MSVNTELLKNRDFRNTLFAIGANQLSDSMSYITTPIIILALTGSPEAASITLFVAGVLATCAGAISGTWVDRIGPSKCLALSCIGQSLSWIAILLYLVFNVTNIYVLVITISLAAIISTFDYPSEQSIITRVVPKEHLGYASGMGETRESTANLLGGPVAGIIISFSTVLMTAVHAVVNLLAFIVAPKSYGASRQPAEEEEGEKTSFWQDSKAGFEYILKNKVLVSIAFVSTLANFGTVGIPLTFIYYYTLEGAHPLFIGIFASAFGVGVLLGSFLVGPLTEKFALGPLGITSLAIMSACYLLLPVVHSMLWAVCLLIVLAGIVLPSFNSSIIAYINASTPEHMIGRVHSVQGIPNMALTPLAVLLAGFLIVDWGITYTALFYAVFIFLSLVVMVFQKPLRQLPHISKVTNAQ